MDSKPPRRVRYRGKHPRSFHEKYKELNPEQHPETIQKVLASGKTPAGMHRPICVQEILEILQPKPGEAGVDCTLGYGGHAVELLKRIVPGGRLVAIDTDPIEGPRSANRIAECGFPGASFSFHLTNFAGLTAVLAREKLPGVDFLLADLGISSMQLDNPERGFSYKVDGPLDLRLNPRKGISAAELLALCDRLELEELLRQNADEPNAALLARAMLDRQRSRSIRTTRDLKELITRTIHSRAEGDAPVRRVFQALRIAVNDEFGVLENLLRILPEVLRPGGRAAILTFHSGEDRRVKSSFGMGQMAGLYSSISEEVVRPSPEEIRANPRASSAKLRWAVRS